MPPKYSGPKKTKSSGYKNNHSVTCYVYQNIALFKGDTYTYRGLFRRYDGFYSKQHYGYLVNIDNVDVVKDELTSQIYGFLIYHRDYDLEYEIPQEFVESELKRSNSQVSFSENDTEYIMDL